MGPLIVIDGHNTFIRAYVASPLMDTNGARCGGTIGMIMSIKKLVNDFDPSNILVVWDGEGGSQRRKSIYKAYKEGRTIRMNKEYDFGETPEENLENMRRQRQNAADLLALLGVPQVRADGVEADDLMAYVAGKMDHAGGCMIVTTDQDMLQLIREWTWADKKCDVSSIGLHNAYEHDTGECTECHARKQSEVTVWSPIKKKMYDRKLFISEHTVLPENFRLVKALTGDGSDNIEGIKGFGLKTIIKCFPFLSERRSTAGEVLEAAKGVKGKVGKQLIEQKDRFLENLQLVDLSEPMLSATAARQAREALYRDIGCRELEFRMLLSKNSLSLRDDNFTMPFKELVKRRRKLITDGRERFDALMAAANEQETQQEVKQELQDTGEKEVE